MNMDQSQKLDKVDQLVRYSGLEQRRARELLESKLYHKVPKFSEPLKFFAVVNLNFKISGSTCMV